MLCLMRRQALEPQAGGRGIQGSGHGRPMASRAKGLAWLRV